MPIALSMRPQTSHPFESLKTPPPGRATRQSLETPCDTLERPSPHQAAQQSSAPGVNLDGRAPSRVSSPQTILRDLPGDLSTSEAIGHIRALRARAHRGEALEKTDLFGFQKTTHDNTVELFTDRTYFTQELLPAIDRAEDSIHLAMLSFDGGELGQYTADKLIAKKRENPDLKVRLILDNVGSGALFPWQDASRNIERMRDAGIEVVVNHTLLNGMEHRKLLLVDGREAYFGGA